MEMEPQKTNSHRQEKIFLKYTLQDAEKDKEETEYMLQENGKPLYE